MNTNKRIAITAAVVFLVVLTFLSGKFKPRPDQLADEPNAIVPIEKEEQAKEPKVETDSRITRLPDGRMLLISAINKGEELYKDGDPQRDLEIVAEILEEYIRFFQEKPFGSENREILDQLLGANSKKLVFLSPESPALSQENELLDRWGSPLIFHPLTTNTMDIRSLGPDQVLWTEDDLSLPFEALEKGLQLQPSGDSL